MRNSDEIQRCLNDKELENQRLKQELNLLKNKIQGNSSDFEKQYQTKQNKSNQSPSSSIDNSEIQPQDRKFTLEGKNLKASKSHTAIDLPDGPKRIAGVMLKENSETGENNASFVGRTERSYGMSQEEDLEYRKRFSHLYTDQRRSSNLNVAKNFKTSSVNLPNNRKISTVKFANIKTSDLNNDLRDESPVPQSYRKHSRNSLLNEFTTINNQNEVRDASPFATSRVHRHKSFVQLDHNVDCITDREIEERKALIRRRHTEIPVGHEEIESSSNPVVQNIQSNIFDIKNQLTNYEKVVDTIHSKIDLGSVDKIKALSKQINELQVKIRILEDEKTRQKESAEAELAAKKELYEQNLSFLKQAHNEELGKMKIDFEIKQNSLKEEYESVRSLI